MRVYAALALAPEDRINVNRRSEAVQRSWPRWVTLQARYVVTGYHGDSLPHTAFDATNALGALAPLCSLRRCIIPANKIRNHWQS